MLTNIHYSQIMFFDVECVPMAASYEEVPSEYKRVWEKRIAHNSPNDDEDNHFYKTMALKSEFNRIVCISVGVYIQQEKKFVLKSFCSKNEVEILEAFSNALEKFEEQRQPQSMKLCGHNIADFDIPLIARRMLINSLELPDALTFFGKKPWEIDHVIDTMNIWKFGSYRYSASLDTLAVAFGVPSPKEDISGADVADVYYKENNLARIQTYCERDVVAVAQVFRRMRNDKLLLDSAIECETPKN